jgi:uncharacterized protein YuzE
MPVNFTDSPSNGNTVVVEGITYTYNSTTTRWESSGGNTLAAEGIQDVVGAMFSSNTETGITATYEDGDGTVDLIVPEAAGITVYATMALLVAVTGMSTGDLAYVTANNKLYLYSVNGWFLIATVSNASPTTITGVSSAYTLATDATATVVTAVSTDPEGFPLTWSYAVTTGSLTNGGGATATVSQSANVFTITPTTTEAYAGTFSITFTVTDGTNAVNAIGAFTLIFAYDWSSTTQQQQLNASDGAASDYFGYKVGIDGDTAICGAFGAAISGDTDAGAAYIFTRSGTTWSQQQKIQASDTEASANFGFYVDVSGNTAICGAYRQDTGGTDAGAAYIFTRSGTTWTQQQKIQSSDIAASDSFGYSVAIDGDTVIVGAYKEDTTATDAGAAYVFTRSGTTWSQQQKLQASDAAATDYFGFNVAIDGNTVIVSAYKEDTTATDAGAAYVFIRSGTTWTQQQKIQASDPQDTDYFGNKVAISGDTVLVGAYKEDTTATDAGAAYIFTRSGTTWSQQQKIQASDIQADDSFGYSTAIDGDVLAVGAYKEDTGASAAGATYIFTRSGTTWTQQKKIQASNPGASDNFGIGLAMSDDTVIVGAWAEDTAASNGGAAYIFVAE